MLPAVPIYAAALAVATAVAALVAGATPAVTTWSAATALVPGVAIGVLAVRREARRGTDTAAGQRRAALRALRIVVLLTVRGVLLWVVVPVALAAWLVVLVARRRRAPRPGWVVAWFDGVVVAGLDRALGRSLGPELRRTRWGEPRRWRVRPADLV